VVQEEAPLAFAVVPATQLVHEVWPAAAYLPNAHLEQAAPVENWPAGQAAHPEDAAPANWPAAHAPHEVDPEALCAVPAAQSTQLVCPVEEAYLPAGHLFAAVEPAGQYEPCGQVVAVVELQNDPVGQEVHAVAPEEEKVPEVQIEHAAPAGEK